MVVRNVVRLNLHLLKKNYPQLALISECFTMLVMPFSLRKCPVIYILLTIYPFKSILRRSVLQPNHLTYFLFTLFSFMCFAYNIWSKCFVLVSLQLLNHHAIALSFIDPFRLVHSFKNLHIHSFIVYSWFGVVERIE